MNIAVINNFGLLKIYRLMFSWKPLVDGAEDMVNIVVIIVRSDSKNN